MAYKIIRFGTSQLIPNANISQDIGTGEARVEAVDFPHGGAFDQMGKDQSFRGGYEINITGTLVAKSASDLQSKYFSLRSHLGKKDRLWRLNGDGTQHWVWARLKAINTLREENKRYYLTLEMKFFIFSPLWNGDLRGSWRLDAGEVLDSGRSLDSDLVYKLTNPVTNVNVVNGGNSTLRSVLMSITAKGTPITKVRIIKTGQTSMIWTGVLGVNSQLTIDLGGLAIKNSGIDAYNGLQLSPADHKVDDWMYLDPGTNLITIIRTGGSSLSEAAFSYYDGWA